MVVILKLQYYIKVFNANNHTLVGYYKETGKNCISKMLNGIKYFNTYESANQVALDLNGGFIRDVDKHYYRPYAVVCGDGSRAPKESDYRNIREKEEIRKDELTAIIRQNSYRVKE